jgi:TRAP-type C4-dicarboxylate transport system substrate-binding protein
VAGPRTATSTKIYGKVIKSPEDFAGLKFRVPGSDSLYYMYRLARARPMKIPWNLCAATARAGRFDALDPSVIGLYSGPDGLNKQLGVISNIESVHDGWVAIGNTHFIDSLDSLTRTGFLDAFEEIQAAQIQHYHRAKTFCAREFAKLGTKIYTPSAAEKRALKRALGHHKPAWNTVKKRLLGEHYEKKFEQLYRAAKG